MKATNDTKTMLRRAVLCVLATLLFCAGTPAQGVYRKDTTLTHVYRNLLSFRIPQGTQEVDIKVRFSISEVSKAGIMPVPPGGINSGWTPRLVRSETGSGWEYALNYLPDDPFPCDRFARIPAGNYYFLFRRTDMLQADTLSFAVAVDNLPGVLETDTPIGFQSGDYAEYVPDPDPDPSYPAPSGTGRTMERSHIVHRRMTDASGTAYTEDIRYFDGLGRPVQTVLVGASPYGGDLADFTDYSKRGRAWRQWKPTAVQGFSGAFVSDLPKRAREYHGDNRPYTETLHAVCPLDRPVSTAARGEAWAEHPERYSYLCNGDSGKVACPQFSVSQEGNLISDGLYPAGMLNVVKHTDSDGNVGYTFTDKQERTVLEHRMDGGEAHDTYYVYDVSGLLRFVLPPAMDGDFSETAQEKYAYRYKYDGLGRLTEKKLPGCRPVRYAYDAMDRVVLEQDGNCAAAGKWKFIAYDALGHEVATGMFPYAGTPSSAVPVWTKDYASAGTGSGITSTGYSTAYGYPSDTEVHTVSYYGDYSFLELPAFSAFADSLQYKPTGSYDTRYTAAGGASGHLTGSRVRSTSGDEILTAYYYDSAGRVIQKASTNHLGGYDYYMYRYDFLGKVVSLAHMHSASGHPMLAEIYNYVYDSRERLIAVCHRLVGEDEVMLAIYTYDGLGRLVSKACPNGGNHPPTYSYNIQDWLTGINSSKFTQTLTYNNGGSGYYNGNISGMSWNANGESHSYTFTYDGLNRMLNATHGTGDYTEKVTAYDKNGNILGLQRYEGSLIDSLTYTYNGNQLAQVEDATGNAAGFSNGASVANEYTYDNNGNLTKDLNKNISAIAYNYLNLPDKVTFSDGSTIEYVYAADGTKLRTVHTINGTVTTKDYCGNVVYENGVRKLLLTEEGYVDLTNSNTYYYYLKDHQGNNRVVTNSLGEVQETNHYYPFGGLFASTGSVQPFKYNGKELDTKKGLNWYDYGARHYDAMLGRWFVVDPLAEKYYGLSPYIYCNNSPIRYIDPTGEDWKDAWPHLQKSFSGNISFGLRVGISANVSSLKVGADINAGSVELGSDGYKLTQGVGIDLGPVGVSVNESVYHIDDYFVASKKSTSINVVGVTIGHDTTTTYDSTGKYFKEVENETDRQMNYSVGLSAIAGLGVDVSVDLSEIWNFMVKLFE